MPTFLSVRGDVYELDQDVSQNTHSRCAESGQWRWVWVIRHAQGQGLPADTGQSFPSVFGLLSDVTRSALIPLA